MSQVYHGGRFYYNNAATNAGEEPGVSSKWTELPIPVELRGPVALAAAAALATDAAAKAEMAGMAELRLLREVNQAAQRDGLTRNLPMRS